MVLQASRDFSYVKKAIVQGKKSLLESLWEISDWGQRW